MRSAISPVPRKSSARALLSPQVEALATAHDVQVTIIVSCLQCMPKLCMLRQSDSSCALTLRPAPCRAHSSAPTEEASGSAGALQGSLSMRSQVCSAPVGQAAPLSDPSSEGMLTSVVDDDVLCRAIMQHLPGCCIRETLGVGGVSACFAVDMDDCTEIAVKVTRKGYKGAGTSIQAFAEVNDRPPRCLPVTQAEGMLLEGHSAPTHSATSQAHACCFAEQYGECMACAIVTCRYCQLPRRRALKASA